jgi:hypothetical protein
VRTGCCIHTLVRQAQTFDGLAADDVAVDDLGDVGFAHAAVPDGVGINHHRGSMLALIETSGPVGADRSIQPSLGQGFLERHLQPVSRIRITASTRMPRLTLIAADENVFSEWCQS